MRWTLREVLKNCRLALKKMLTKRDKWVKEWPGQVTVLEGHHSLSVVLRIHLRIPRGGSEALSRELRSQLSFWAGGGEA